MRRIMKPQRPKDRRRVRAKYAFKRRRCAFCAARLTNIDYKDPAKLCRYISDRGRIGSRYRSGTCPKHQRALAQAIKRARHLALLPYTPAHIHKTGGVGLRE